jgi:hypothetical protein
MPQENCDTGRRIFDLKRLAQMWDEELGHDPGRAEKCDRCKGWHAAHDRPRSRRTRNRKLRR